MQKLEIYSDLPCLNDYIHAIQRNRFAGNQMKKMYTDAIAKLAKMQLKPIENENMPVMLKYTFHEKNRRRDKDNIAAFAMKVIQDGLVTAGILPNDGWKQIEGFRCEYKVGNEGKVRVEIYEKGEY